MSMLCNSCKFDISSAEVRNTHYRSEWHRYNIKRSVAGLAPMAKELFDSKVSALKERQDREKEAKSTQKCTTCNKTFNTAAAYSQHLVSKTHLKREKKKAKSKESKATPAPKKRSSTPARAPATSQTCTDNPAESVVCLECGKVFASVELRIEHQSQVNHKQSITTGVATGPLVSPPAEGPAEGPVEEPLDDATTQNPEDGDDFEYDEDAAIPLKQCLFCNQKFTTIEKSLTHMLKTHGFFVPFVEYLHDIEGLMEYLGAKVGIGRVCLHCNGRGRLNYPTVTALQQHMIAKSHCKIRFEEDEEDDEFLDYYNFPNSKQNDEGDSDEEGGPEEPINGTRKRHVAGLNAANELIMSDGALIGHRDNSRAYKLNPRPYSRDDEIKALIGKYKQLEMDGYSNKLARKKTFNERKFHYFDKSNRVALSVSYRANSQKHYKDATGLY